MGKNESLQRVCECGRVVLTAEKQVECNLSYLGGTEAEEETRMAPVGGSSGNSKKTAKKTRRIPIGVPSPFDSIVRNTERWSKEKAARMAVLTDKKILVSSRDVQDSLMKAQQTVTSILLEKIPADMVDDFWNRERGRMENFVQEYFLSVYGMRTLADFYLLELLEGVKVFLKSHKRILHFAKFAGLRYSDEEPYDGRQLDFYLEVCKELAMIGREGNKKASMHKERGKSLKVSSKPDLISTAKLSHEVKMVQEAGEKERCR
eukprot:30143-Hanusia_phi.AAC.1